MFLLAGILCLALMPGCARGQNNNSGVDNAEIEQYFLKETLSQEQEATLPICRVADNCMDYIKQTISYNALSELLKSKPTLEELNANISLEFVRKLDTSYRAVMKTEQGWVQAFFNQDGTFAESVKMGKLKSVLKDDLLKIPFGMPVKQVQEIDPDGDYNFMYASWSGYPKKSYHYTSDGYVFSIYYDDAYEVMDISFALI